MNIKIVHTLHSVAKEENTRLARKLNKIFFKNAAAIPVALSENVQNTIVDEYDLKREAIPVVFNGVDLSVCRVKKNYSYVDKFKILHIGRFQDVKNHKGLIEAFEIFHKKYPNSELYLIGDGELRSEIEDYVNQNGLKSSVRFLGLQSNVHKYISTMDVFALPSKYEGLPMTIIEAMGSGMPIVATRVGGVPDMLDEESALLIPVEVEAIADAFEKYYLNEDLRRSHGIVALERSKQFSAQTMARNYLNLYQKGEYK